MIAKTDKPQSQIINVMGFGPVINEHDIDITTALQRAIDTDPGVIVRIPSTITLNKPNTRISGLI